MFKTILLLIILGVQLAILSTIYYGTSQLSRDSDGADLTDEHHGSESQGGGSNEEQGGSENSGLLGSNPRLHMPFRRSNLGGPIGNRGSNLAAPAEGKGANLAAPAQNKGANLAAPAEGKSANLAAPAQNKGANLAGPGSALPSIGGLPGADDDLTIVTNVTLGTGGVKTASKRSAEVVNQGTVGMATAADLDLSGLAETEEKTKAGLTGAMDSLGTTIRTAVANATKEAIAKQEAEKAAQAAKAANTESEGEGDADSSSLAGKIAVTNVTIGTDGVDASDGPDTSVRNVMTAGDAKSLRVGALVEDAQATESPLSSGLLSSAFAEDMDA